MSTLDLTIEDRCELARRKAIPIPWTPPMPAIDWLPYRRVYRRLVAEAVASRLRGVIPALDGVEPAWAAEADHLVRVLEAAAIAPAEPAEAA